MVAELMTQEFALDNVDSDKYPYEVVNSGMPLPTGAVAAKAKAQPAQPPPPASPAGPCAGAVAGGAQDGPCAGAASPAPGLLVSQAEFEGTMKGVFETLEVTAST